MIKPYTIRLFIPDGSPDSLKVIDKMNWTGIGLDIARESWQKHRTREELERAGVYILLGYQEGEDLPTLYIGQGDGVRSRIDAHEKKKDFWDKVLVFVSSNNGLNRAHITWLEWALIQRAQDVKRCRLENSVTPAEPILTEAEKSDTLVFLNEILSILPLVDLRVFEHPKIIKPSAQPKGLSSSNTKINLDTIVVPANQEGFEKVFLGEHCWYAIRISAGKLKDIKYIAAYQTAPMSAVTHLAEVDSIEPYGDRGKYKINFKSPAKSITPIPSADAPAGCMQGPRYANHQLLNQAKKLVEIFDPMVCDP